MEKSDEAIEEHMKCVAALYPSGCTNYSVDQSSSNTNTTPAMLLIQRYTSALSNQKPSSLSQFPCFVDPDFPPNSHSLFGVCPYAILKSEPTLPTETGVLPLIEWRTPKQWIHGNDIVIFDEVTSISCTDIRKGQLDNFAFLASLIALAEFDQALKYLIDL